MTTLREAAQQALEALEHSVKLRDCDYDAVDALRAALEKPEYPLGKATTDVGVPVYVVKKAEPVQEPVAWALHTGTKQGIKWNRRVEHGTPLYTAPPQRKPLTEETMRECAQVMDAEPLAEGWHELIKFARAIEREHGIKP